MVVLDKDSFSNIVEVAALHADVVLPSVERDKEKKKQEEDDQRQQEEMRQREQQAQVQQRLAELLKENTETDRAPRDPQANSSFFRVVDETSRDTNADIKLGSMRFQSESQQSIRDFFRERQILVNKLVDSLERDLFETVERSSGDAAEKTGLNRVVADTNGLNQATAELLATSKDILNQRKLTELAFLLEDEVVKTNPELKKRVEMLLSEMEDLVGQSRDLRAERERAQSREAEGQQNEVLTLDNYRFSISRQGFSSDISLAA